MAAVRAAVTVEAAREEETAALHWAAMVAAVEAAREMTSCATDVVARATKRRTALPRLTLMASNSVATHRQSPRREVVTREVGTEGARAVTTERHSVR